ncbi:condensation protein [Desulfosporosinus sp. SB140]|uniref:condensation protein n=1 Tax=Desulfosporosinus paludis TaxID=3115649 RepID=UPI00388CF0ED
MEIKIKLGDAKIKISYEGLFKKLARGENLFEAMLPLFHLDHYYKFYENLPLYMVSYYKELGKVFEKYLDINKPGIGKIPDSPDVLPANGHDIYNYIARYGMGNFHPQAILRLDGRLDFDRLVKAVRLSVDAEPVLGCRFVEGNPPYWKRSENIDEVMFCSLEEVPDANTTVQRFLESPLDMDNDPKVKVKLIRSDECDIVGIKVNHACCDGTGIKEYVQLVSDIYSRLDGSGKAFVPIQSIRGRGDQDRLFKSLGIADPDSLWIPGSDILIPTWAFPWKQDTSSTTRIAACRISPDQVDAINSYVKSRGATINDMILAAYYRAMLKMGQPVYGVPMGINLTVDLRRYLPDNKTEALRNFSGSVNTWLSMVENESFDETLSRVVYMMNDIKRGYPGLQSAIGLERLEKISFKEALAYYQATTGIGKNRAKCPVYTGNRCIASLSNIGILSKELIKMGDVIVSDYYIIPPVVSAPGLLLVANTYNGIMRLAAGFFKDTVLSSDVEMLLNNIKNEMLEGCRQ